MVNLAACQHLVEECLLLWWRGQQSSLQKLHRIEMTIRAFGTEHDTKSACAQNCNEAKVACGRGARYYRADSRERCTQTYSRLL